MQEILEGRTPLELHRLPKGMGLRQRQAERKAARATSQILDEYYRVIELRPREATEAFVELREELEQTKSEIEGETTHG
jgi:hypothetical protein